MKGAKNSCQTKEKNICRCGRQQVGHVVESQFQFGASGQNRPQAPPPSPNSPQTQYLPPAPPTQCSLLLHITPSKPLAAALS